MSIIWSTLQKIKCRIFQRRAFQIRYSDKIMAQAVDYCATSYYNLGVASTTPSVATDEGSGAEQAHLEDMADAEILECRFRYQ